MEKAGGGADAALRLLGLARRAGAVEPGTERARNALRSGTAKLVLVAEDASLVQLKKIEGLLLRESVPRAVLGSRAVLGAAVGTGPLSAVAVTERGFAEQLLRRLGDAGPHHNAL